MNQQLILEIPEELLTSLNESGEELIKDMKLITAITFYKEGKLSMGKAIEFAGVNRLTFMGELSKRKISIFNYTPEDLEQDIMNLESIKENE
jgi:predicted HTH domain antitoxin